MHLQIILKLHKYEETIVANTSVIGEHNIDWFTKQYLYPPTSNLNEQETRKITYCVMEMLY